MTSWLLIAGCLSLAAMYSGVEAGIFSLKRVRLRHRAKTGDKAAAKLQRLLEHPERLLVTVILVTNFMTAGAFLLATQRLLTELGWIAWVISPLVFLPVYLVLVEWLPKAFFRRFPFRLLAPFAEVLRLTDLALSPLIKLSNKLVNPFLPKPEGKPHRLFAAREDFKYLAAESEREGTLSSFERKMIHHVVDFRSVRVRDVMLPMERVITINSSASVEELLFLGKKHDIDRFPVVARNGELAGMVNVFEVLLDRTPRGNISQYQRRLISLNASEPAYNALRKMRAARVGLAAVAEPERVVGIVSYEELVARLVNAAKSEATGPPGR